MIARFVVLLLALLSAPAWAYTDYAAAYSACMGSTGYPVDQVRCQVYSAGSTWPDGYTPSGTNNYVLNCGRTYGGGPMYCSGYAYGGAPCPSPKVLQNHACVDPPPPPPECPAGQSWASPSDSCVPDTPEPEGGATDEVGVEVCRPPTDCSTPSNWDEWSYTTNKDGWIWKASDPHQCVQTGTGSVVCNTQIVYAAGGPATTSTVVSAPVASGTTYAPPVTVSCPTGYTLNSSGVCEQPPVAGTPTTDTTPGSTGSPGAVTCPVGYYADGSGGCKSSGTGAPNAYGCPEGYTKAADGSCQGAGGEIPGVFGPDATGANKVSSCGGPGQPACNVSFGGNFDTPASDPLQTLAQGPSVITPVAVAAPQAVCPADVQLPRGITWSWATICDFALFLRPFVLALAWLAAGWFVLG